MPEFIQINHIVFKEDYEPHGFLFLHIRKRYNYTEQSESLNLSAVNSASSTREEGSTWMMEYFSPMVIERVMVFLLCLAEVPGNDIPIVLKGISLAYVLYIIFSYSCLKIGKLLTRGIRLWIDFMVVFFLVPYDISVWGVLCWVAWIACVWASIKEQSSRPKESECSEVIFYAIKITFNDGKTRIFNLLESEYLKVAAQLGLQEEYKKSHDK